MKSRFLSTMNASRNGGLFAILAAVLLLIHPAVGAVPNPPANLRPAWIHGWPANYARLNWDAVPGATSYTLYRYNETTPAWEVVATGLTNAYAFDEVVGTAEKSYFVTAVGSEGESSPSAAVTTHDNELITQFIHSRPDANSGTVTPTTATFNWVVSLVTGTDGMLELGVDAGNLAVVYFETNYQAGFGVTVTNLQPATQYYYRITGVGPNRAGVAVPQTFWTPNINHPPVADDITFGAIVDPWPVTFPLTATDPDGLWSPLAIAIVTPPTNGTLSEIYYFDYWGPRYVDYQPNPGARGADFFQFVANDGELDSAPGTVSMPSIWLNRSPQPPSFVTNTLEDVALAMDLTAFDADGDAVTYQFFALDGTIAGTPPNVIYTPDPNFNGQGVILYEANDGYPGGFAQGYIQIEVAPVNDPPVVGSFAVESPEDTTFVVALSAADVEGDSVDFEIVSQPEHGSLAPDPSGVAYTPHANFHGTDSFTYRASDGMATSEVATVTILVVPVNDGPVAAAGAVESVEDDWSTAVVLSGLDPDGDPLTYSIETPPSHGTLSPLSAFVTYLWIYRPAANYNGPDSFTFRVNDGTLSSEPATVSITVAPVNDPPTIAAQSLTTQEDVTLPFAMEAGDIDGEFLTFIVVVPPAHGDLSGTGPDYLYTPAANYNGYDEFVVSVTDAAGVSRSATNTIAIQPVADAPVATSMTLTTPYNTPVTFQLTASDPDGGVLSFVVTSPPANGGLTGASPSLTFSPVPGFVGDAALEFVVFDGGLTSTPGSVTIAVQPPVSVPAAPGNLTATAVSKTQIDLAWTDHAGFGEDGFKVERSLNGNSWTQIGTTGPNVTAFASTGLSGNKTYYHRVRAYNVLGDSAYSNTASARTPK